MFQIHLFCCLPSDQVVEMDEKLVLAVVGFVLRVCNHRCGLVLCGLRLAVRILIASQDCDSPTYERLIAAKLVASLHLARSLIVLARHPSQRTAVSSVAVSSALAAAAAAAAARAGRIAG